MESKTVERLAALMQRVLEEKIDVSTLTPQTRLKEDLGLNSIGMLYMALALEEEFGLTFCNEDLAQLHTVADVLRRIE